MVKTSVDQKLGQGESTSQETPLSPIRDEYLFFGPLGKGVYLTYGPQHPNDNDYSVEMIRAAFSDKPDGSHAMAREARGIFWNNFELLWKHLTDCPVNNSLDLVTDLYSFVTKHNPLAETQLGAKRDRLGLHLENVFEFCEQFLISDSYCSRIPSLLSNRHAHLLTAVVAPLHDLLKYLGNEASQIIPDHEIVLAEIGKEFFLGRSVKINGVSSILTKEDVFFVTSIIGDHENIYKEFGRDLLISSQDPIQRAKALFSFVDTLAGAFEKEPDRSNAWQLNELGFRKRFVDLCSRHIAGKVFRPRWIVSSTQELILTINHLSEFKDNFGTKAYNLAGIEAGSSAKEAIIDGAIEGIDSALRANQARVLKNNKNSLDSTVPKEETLSACDLDTVNFCRQQLLKLKDQ